MRPSHDQRRVPMETQPTNCAVSENKPIWACQRLNLHLLMISHINCKCKCSVSKCFCCSGAVSECSGANSKCSGAVSRDFFEALHLQNFTVTVRGSRRLWRHRIVWFGTHLTDGLNISVIIWRLSPLITVRDLQLVGMHAKFHQIIRENVIDLLYFNKQPSKYTTHL